MSWLRCAKCRTLNQEQDRFCIGCGTPVSGARSGPVAPALGHAVERDRKRAGAFITVMGILGGVGLVKACLIALAMPDWRVVGGGILVICAAVGIMLVLRRDDPSYDALGRVILSGLAVVGLLFLAGAALVIGLVILIFVACATGKFP